MSDSLAQTIKDTDLQDITIDLAETLTDSVLEDSIIKDVPILGTIIGLTRSVVNLRDRLFLKKIIYFLTNLNSIPQAKRHDMVSKIESSDDYKIKVGEKLLYIIDKCEDHKSAERSGKLFSAFLDGAITYSDFLRGASIIDKIFSEDLDLFLKENIEDLQKVESLSDDPLSDFQHRLVNAGLFSSSINPVSVEDQNDWKMTDKYIVKGGRASVYLTEIGSVLKMHL